MPCIKTGCQIYIVPLGIWAYGDAHECGEAYYFRLVEEKDKPRANMLHFEVGNYDQWWDRDRMRGNHYTYGDPSILIANKNDVVSHGYDGTPIDPVTLIPEIWK